MDDLDLEMKTNGAIEMSPAHEGEVTARVSTSNVMPKTAKILGLAGRYIQVGAYGRTANADRAHKRLAQVGSPAEHCVVNRNGSQLNLYRRDRFRMLHICAAHWIVRRCGVCGCLCEIVSAMHLFDYPPQIPCSPTQSVSFKTGRAGLGRLVSADRSRAVS